MLVIDFVMKGLSEVIVKYSLRAFLTRVEIPLTELFMKIRFQRIRQFSEKNGIN